MCVLVSKNKKKELGCFLFRMLARVRVFACLWLRLGLCLHGGASVSLFAWCVPPCLHGAASVSLFTWCVPPFFPPPSIETAVGTSDFPPFFSGKNLSLFPTNLLSVHPIAETCGSLFRNFKIILKFDELILI